MKRFAWLLLALILLAQSLVGGAMAQSAQLRYDASREIAAYLDSVDKKYNVDTSNDYDLFVAAYTPDEAQGIERITMGVYVMESGVVKIMVPTLVKPDTSDMATLYQTLERINDSISFVRFCYDTGSGTIYSLIDANYVPDADFGHLVERYMYICALVTDQNYNELAALA